MKITTENLHFFSNTVNPSEDYKYCITYCDFNEIMCGDYIIPPYLYKDLFNVVCVDASNDNVQAQFFLSLLLKRGIGCTENIEKSKYWLEQAFDASNFYALLYVFLESYPFQVRGALFYTKERNENRAFSASAELYTKHKLATPLALCYQYGIGCTVNERLSLTYYKEAYLNHEYLERGWIKPYDEISKYYSNCGTFKNIYQRYCDDNEERVKDERKVEYLQKQADNGDEFALFLLAEYYEKKHKRILWEEQINKLIEKEFGPAYYRMGYYLVQEVSWKYRNNKKAIEYLEKAVELCPRNVFYREYLAHCYAYKTTNMLNPQRAINLYKSIGIGSSKKNTEELISKYYLCGGYGFRDYYVEQSDEEKRQGLIVLANSNDPYAQYYWGISLLKENNANISEALSLLAKSFNNGFKKSCEPIIEYFIKNKDYTKALDIIKKAEYCNYYPSSIKDKILEVPILHQHVYSLYSYQLL